MGVTTLALLDGVNTSSYGNLEITSVKSTHGPRLGILSTGHNLKAWSLEQSKDAGMDVYTHGEMLMAHAYPAFKKYAHLYDNYCGSWHVLCDEFEKFNGPVLVTTNGVVPPNDPYAGRIFPTGLAGYPGVKHITASVDMWKDLSGVIDAARMSQPQ